MQWKLPQLCIDVIINLNFAEDEIIMTSKIISSYMGILSYIQDQI